MGSRLYAIGVSAALLLAGVPLLGAAGCGAGGEPGAGPGKPCTAIGAPEMVAVEIAPGDAEDVRSGTVEVCDGGDCTTEDLELSDETRTVDEGCDGGSCSARSEPTGGMRGKAQFDGLPTQQVDVRVVLTADDGAEVFDETAAVRPEMVEPNGPGCGEQGPQAQLTIENGRLEPN
ncbi:hypothetical protein [Nocardiopsis coralliicola]